MNELIAISPADLPFRWPEIRDEVASIDIPDGFIMEDAYAMCRQNAATLFYLMVDGKRVGWMIARMAHPDLHIWMLHAESGFDVMTTFRNQLMGLARGANAKHLTYGSLRQAWAKVAPKHGFKMRMVVYECPVDQPQPIISANDSGADENSHVTH